MTKMLLYTCKQILIGGWKALANVIIIQWRLRDENNVQDSPWNPVFWPWHDVSQQHLLIQSLWWDKSPRLNQGSYTSYSYNCAHLSFHSILQFSNYRHPRLSRLTTKCRGFLPAKILIHKTRFTSLIMAIGPESAKIKSQKLVE